MSWTAPMTAVANSAFTAAQFNTYVRDNLLETAPAKATTAGRIFVATGVSTIAERAVQSNVVATAEGTGNAAYVDLATVGPSITATTGPFALALWSADVSNSTLDIAGLMSVAVSGATTTAASDNWALLLRAAAGTTQRAAMVELFALTAGSNVFTAKYRAQANTATFANRRLQVIAL